MDNKEQSTDELDDFYTSLEQEETLDKDNNSKEEDVVKKKESNKRKHEDDIEETEQSKNNNATTTTTSTTTNTTTKTPTLMVPHALLHKKQAKIKSTSTPNNSSGSSVKSSCSSIGSGVISSKAVTYSQSTISKLKETESNEVRVPSYASQMLMREKPMVSMEQPKQVKYTMGTSGDTWEDQSMSEWDVNDFRLFVGQLGNEVTDEMLSQAFQKYTTFLKAKVVRDKKTLKSKGYGFVSFASSTDCLKALKEMNNKYVGNRPLVLKKSTWRDRATKAEVI